MSEQALFIDSAGDVRPVAPEDIAGVSQLGWLPASPAQIHDYELQQKHGTPGQALLTGFEQAGSALTFGASTALERAAGVPAEDILAREKANPTASTIGTVAGIAAPLLTPAGPLKAAAELTAPSLIAKAGSGITKALTPEATTMAGRILGRGAASAVGSAVEGAFYGTGNVVHEAALGDPDLTAQNALATVGLTAALGGALGFVGGASIEGLTQAVGKARKALGGIADATATPEKLAGAVQEHYDAMNGATRIAAKTLRPEETAALIRPTPEAAQGELIRVVSRIDEVAQEMRAKPELFPQTMYPAKLEAIRDSLIPRGLTELPDSAPHEIFEALNDAKQTLDKQIGKWGKLISPEQQDAVQAIRGIRGEIKNALENEAVWGKAGARQAAYNDALSEWLDAKKDFEKEFMIKKPGKRVTPDFTADAADLSRLSDQANPRTPARQAIFDRWVETSKALTKEIETSAQHSPVTGFDSGALEGLVNKTADMAQKNARQGAVLRILGQVSGMAPVGTIAGGMIGGAAGAAVGVGFDLAAKAAKYVPRAVDVLSRFERNNNAVTNAVRSAASTLVRAGPKAANVGRAEASAGIAKVFALEPDELRAAYTKRVESIRKLTNDPQQLLNALEEQSADWHMHAPETAQAMNTATARAVAFLASKIPQSPPLAPFSPEWNPSRDEMATFMRYWQALEDPLHSLKQAAVGTLSEEAMEALQVVHPHFLDAARAALIEYAANHQPIPYQQRLGMARFLGRDIDGTLAQDTLAHAQASFLMPPPQMGGAGKSGGTKFGKLKFSERALTGTQSASRWEERK